MIGRSKRAMTKRFLFCAMDYYSKCFKSINKDNEFQATFDIVCLTGWQSRPKKGQQALNRQILRNSSWTVLRKFNNHLSFSWLKESFRVCNDRFFKEKYKLYSFIIKKWMNCMFHDRYYWYISCFFAVLKLNRTSFIRIQIIYSNFGF